MSTKAKSSLKDGSIEYGDVEMTEEEYLEAQNPKVRTTVFLDADLIRACKKEALKRGIKYQQLMREILRQGLAQSSDVESRLKRLEKKVFKKA